MARVRLTKSAQSDLAEIWHFIAIEQMNLINADAVSEAFDECFQLIAKHPRTGEEVEHLRMNTRRVIVKKRFLVFYEAQDTGVLIRRVLHDSRLIRPDDLT